MIEAGKEHSYRHNFEHYFLLEDDKILKIAIQKNHLAIVSYIVRLVLEQEQEKEQEQKNHKEHIRFACWPNLETGKTIIHFMLEHGSLELIKLVMLELSKNPRRATYFHDETPKKFDSLHFPSEEKTVYCEPFPLFMDRLKQEAMRNIDPEKIRENQEELIALFSDYIPEVQNVKLPLELKSVNATGVKQEQATQASVSVTEIKQEKTQSSANGSEIKDGPRPQPEPSAPTEPKPTNQLICYLKELTQFRLPPLNPRVQALRNQQASDSKTGSEPSQLPLAP